ncbi:MAG: pyridoxal phosphate-dependent aminotransferase [Chlorobi bacterium]|nr:pyridoxal phosphate-dependent aminotransferase [Chlorobiota bacterium]
MRIKKSGAKYSAIVGIGEQLKKMSSETGREFLYLNRGINAVVNINLTNVIPLIDFNSNALQVYPANSGIIGLKKAINSVYFHNNSGTENIFITNGGMNALDLIIRTINVEKIFIAEYFWGAYINIMKINNTPFSTYFNFDYIKQNIEQLKNNAIIICDPNNPLGTKIDDNELIDIVNFLNKNNVTIIWDSPYRRLFLDNSDMLYSELLAFENVIITDSFSKSLGLSGQRIGFVHSLNKEFNEQFNINLLYNTNGINAFSQLLVERLLQTEEGKKATTDFKQTTVEHISKNINYLIENGIIASEFYTNAKPIGIFVIVNKNYQQLLDAKIGSVPLSFFTLKNDKSVENNARICVSVNHDKFKRFFSELLN